MIARNASDQSRSGLFSRHPRAVPAILGFLSGLLVGPVVIGAAFPAYVVGRAGAGARICAAGLFVGLVATESLAQTASSGCLGCVDTLAIVARAYAILLVAFAAGWLLGRWAARRGASLDVDLDRTIASHRLVAPAVLGAVSGLLLGPLVVGAAIPGYLVGRAGASASIATAGLLVGFTVTVVGMVNAMVASGCPSCVDAFIAAPATVLFLLIPYGIGLRLGRSAARRSSASTLAAA